ncbi:MAG: carbohydrate kinase [Bacteroidales bacterium]|nr:carbohydrate kinase [Bacteroidales bacterium]MCF8392147.1 carbohydrate kinase [Bacteroidales bacterium]
MYIIGYDIGSSSVKASLIKAESGELVSSAFYPKQEMAITAKSKGWAEQEPEQWWENLKMASLDVTQNIDITEIKAIGISYQMHGLVMIDKKKKVIRPSIIWCDSRAVHYGEEAYKTIGQEICLSHSLNSPGNFTASKFKWVKENEQELFQKTWKIMLPGDYIAMKMTGEVNTTISGLSEGILWDFKNNSIANYLMDYYGFDNSVIPEIVPTFSNQGHLMPEIATELNLPAGIPVSYRAGDQPNNAFSLNVLNPGEIAATAGTSGVVYGISEEVKYDPLSRVNSFAHVNHSPDLNRLGVLLCINGTGILYSWLKKNFGLNLSYEELNKLAEIEKIGSEGLSILPFGNGAERMLGNVNPGCQIKGLNFNSHGTGHIIRAAQEGIVFSFVYGMEIMKTMGINPKIIKAGNANMFLSPVFQSTLAGTSKASIELYDTDGSVGAAKGAGIGAGIYANYTEAFNSLKKIKEIHPDTKSANIYQDAYQNWKQELETLIN